MKLPKLELKSFSGNYEEWQSFWDTFESAVNRNTDISRIQKFTYLKSCVTGAAESAITGLPLTEDNYETAIDILRDRFGKPQLLISNHMDALLKLPIVSSVHETKKLRDLYDKIEINIRSLKALGIESESFGNLLVPVVMEKIPSELRLIISRKFGSKETWDLDVLLNALKSELEARERCNVVKTSSPTNSNPRFDQHKGRFKQPLSSSALYAGSEECTLQCVFCKKNHKSITCSTITEPKARRTILRRSGRCFVCLKAGHITPGCQSKAKCFNCGARHHVTICENPKKPVQPSSSGAELASLSRSETSQERSRDVGTSTMHVGSNNNSVLLQTAQAFISRPDNQETGKYTQVIFDSCSHQRSYITSKTREQLNLPTVGKETLLIKTFGNNSASVKECDIVQLCIRTIDAMSVYVTAYVVPVICSPVSNQEIQSAVECYPYLQGLQLACGAVNGTVSVDLLIAADHYWSVFTGRIIRGDPSGPVALETMLGWVLSEPAAVRAESCTINLSATHVLEIESGDISHVQDDLQKFWDLETLGIRDTETSVHDKFSNEIRFTGERYQVKLPFKDNHPMLSDNYTNASRRLATVIKKLKTQPEILEQYDQVIKEQLESGVVEEVRQDQVLEPGNVHYLPHRGVVRLDRDTTKVRVVYDASSKVFGPSLNDCLHVGPSLNPLLLDILLRFRVHEVAVTADIEKAFLNIEIDPEHRDFLRFLWVDDVDKESPEIKLLRFTRVVFGVNASPFILNATIRHHVNICMLNDNAFALEFLKSLYVDDFASGAKDVNNAFSLSKEITLCPKSGGFNIRKRNSNSASLLQSLKQDAAFSGVFSTNSKVFKQGTEKEQKVLGML